MVTWLIFLPWALWEDCQWLTIPITGIITFLLLGIENIGIQARSVLLHASQISCSVEHEVLVMALPRCSLDICLFHFFGLACLLARWIACTLARLLACVRARFRWGAAGESLRGDAWLIAA